MARAGENIEFAATANRANRLERVAESAARCLSDESADFPSDQNFNAHIFSTHIHS